MGLFHCSLQNSAYSFQCHIIKIKYKQEFIVSWHSARRGSWWLIWPQPNWAKKQPHNWPSTLVLSMRVFLEEGNVGAHLGSGEYGSEIGTHTMASPVPRPLDFDWNDIWVVVCRSLKFSAPHWGAYSKSLNNGFFQRSPTIEPTQNFSFTHYFLKFILIQFKIYLNILDISHLNL